MRTNEKLLRWRLSQKLSQRQAAALAEMSQPAWQSYEAGTSMPKVPAATKIQRATKGHIKVSEWRESDEDRAVRKARSDAHRVNRPKVRTQSRRTGTDG